MAIPEACGLWIEQRLKEEIEETGDTRKSFSAIARDVTAEVNRVFETNIKFETIRSRARRVSRSNDHPDTTTQNDKGKSKFEKLEKTKHGGKREGAGRKKKPVTDPFFAMRFYAFYCARMAIIQLENIGEGDLFGMEAFTIVETWVKKGKERMSSARGIL